MSPRISLLTAYSSCVMLIAILVLSDSSSLAVAQHLGGKRFDCRLFCKMTGYHGSIGGCRCSFTLFTAKRSQPPGFLNVRNKRSLTEFNLGDTDIQSENLPSTMTPSYYRIKLPLMNKTKRLNNEADEWNTPSPSPYFSPFYSKDPSYIDR